MIMEMVKNIPPNLTSFLLVTLFSLLIGLSQRKIHSAAREADRTFGTDRTFTFIGILGFILYLLEPAGASLFMGGGVILALIMAVSYYFHIRDYSDFGATTIFIGLITYTLGPLVLTQPLWMVLLIVVVVLIFTEMKDTFTTITQKFDRYEFITLAKFLAIAGVILPIVPDEPFITGLTLSPYKIWLAVVVISTISYVSYLLKKFVFRQAGIVLSGILGGLYSSTATTIILAKKSASDPDHLKHYMASIIIATAMMYLRILVLILIFNAELFGLVWPWFAGLFGATMVVGFAIYWYSRETAGATDTELPADRNPLEFKVALIFTMLFVAFSFVTYEVINRFGAPGLNVLSFIVGLTDIDPFLINLFQGKSGVAPALIAAATFQAIISNNAMKMFYGVFFGGKTAAFYLVPAFILIIALTIIPVLCL